FIKKALQVIEVNKLLSSVWIGLSYKTV
ncbi:MAG: hypothetical protein AVDCRST_MAG95-1435, partial [uncultured Adhaeribacter sp.]